MRGSLKGCPDIFRPLFVAVLALWLLACAQVSVAQDDRPLRFTVPVGWYPYAMQERWQGPLTGVFLDLLKMVQDETGLETEYVDLSWKRALQFLKDAQVDTVCGMYRTLERERFYRFSPPLFTDEVRVFVTKPLQVKTLDDLIGLRGDAPLGARYGEPFDTYAEKWLTLERVTDKRQSFKKLLHGRTDYVVSAYADGVLTLAGMEGAEEVHALPFVVAMNDVYWAYPRSGGRQKLYDEVDRILLRLVEAGAVSRLYERYLDEAIRREADQRHQEQQSVPPGEEGGAG